MYERGTILTLREPRPDVEVGEGEDKHSHPFPYNRVRVLGQSPINHSSLDSEWVGQQGQGVIIEALSSFASNLDEPFGKLQELYEVESIPEPEVVENVIKRVTPESLGPSPEDKFAAEQKAAGIVKSPTRVPTPVSPLDEDPQAAERAAKVEEAKQKLRDGASTDRA
jgi:hypothetical protein